MRVADAGAYVSAHDMRVADGGAIARGLNVRVADSGARLCLLESQTCAQQPSIRLSESFVVRKIVCSRICCQPLRCYYFVEFPASSISVGYVRPFVRRF